jgi:hypothetical protein
MLGQFYWIQCQIIGDWLNKLLGFFTFNLSTHFAVDEELYNEIVNSGDEPSTSLQWRLVHYAKSRAASIGKKMQIISLRCNLNVMSCRGAKGCWMMASWAGGLDLAVVNHHHILIMWWSGVPRAISLVLANWPCLCQMAKDGLECSCHGLQDIWSISIELRLDWSSVMGTIYEWSPRPGYGFHELVMTRAGHEP